MVKEKREINTRVAGLNNLPYFPWISAIVVSAKGSGQHFCCCWTHVNISTSGCGFIMSALRLNQCCCCFFSSNGCLGVPPPPPLFSFYLDRLVWPLVLGPLQLGRPHPPLFPWASAPPHCSQTWRNSSAERDREWKEQKGRNVRNVSSQPHLLTNRTARFGTEVVSCWDITTSWNSSTFAGISLFGSVCVCARVGDRPAPPQWEAQVPVAAWAHLAE